MSPPSTAFNYQFEPNSRSLPLWYCTSVLHKCDITFCKQLCEIFLYACTRHSWEQHAGAFTACRVQGPARGCGTPLVSVPGTSCFFCPSCHRMHTWVLYLPVQSASLEDAGAAPGLQALSSPWELVPCTGTRLCSTQGCSDSSMCYLGKSKFSITVLEKCPKSPKNLTQDIHKSFLLQLSEDV